MIQGMLGTSDAPCALGNHAVVEEAHVALPGVRCVHPGLFMGEPRCGSSGNCSEGRYGNPSMTGG